LGDAQGNPGCVNGGYSGCAGYFNGNVKVNGSFYALAKNFVIDHPVDPAHKVLVHASIEAPEMMNVYSGNVILDGHGEAWIELPAYFEALNKDFRYQLTNIGAFARTYIAEKVTDNRFKIAGGIPGMEVSWQVTGVRHDSYAEDHPMIVEGLKAPADSGKYYYSRNAADPRLGPATPSGPEDTVLETAGFTCAANSSCAQ
jgi:hypothetical protein